jgi:hypothetical protein
MNNKPLIAAACAALAGFLGIVATGAADAQSGSSPAAQEIVPVRAQASQHAPAEFFTGRVRVDPLWATSDEIIKTLLTP